MVENSKVKEVAGVTILNLLFLRMVLLLYLSPLLNLSLLNPRGLGDYTEPTFEESILIESNFEELWAWYFIPPFDLFALDRESRVTLALDRCVSIYEESLWVGLWLLLHPFIRNFFDFYSILPAQITPNTSWIIVTFIFVRDLARIEPRCYLFKALFILKKHPWESWERGWWYFFSWPRCKFITGLPSSIQDWKSYFFFIFSN